MGIAWKKIWATLLPLGDLRDPPGDLRDPLGTLGTLAGTLGALAKPHGLHQRPWELPGKKLGHSITPGGTLGTQLETLGIPGDPCKATWPPAESIGIA